MSFFPLFYANSVFCICVECFCLWLVSIKSSIKIIPVSQNVLTLYDPGGGGFKRPPPIICSHAFNFGAALLCVGDFSQKIV